jgi:CheY-like chemotaxis protein
MVEDSGSGFKGINIEMNKPYHYHDKGKKNKEGSGFGLYMVTEILKAVGSEIKFQTSDKGSMFYFDLIETCPFNEVIDLSKMYSNYLRQVIDDINAGKKDNVNIICSNLENKLDKEGLNKTKSPQINKHKYIMYPHNNAIINLLGTDKKLSIIPDKSIKKQISMRKVLKKNKSIFKIDKRKIQGLNSYNYYAGNETLRDNQNIDAIGGFQDIMEEDNRPLFTVIICDDEGMICESIKRILKNIFESYSKFNKYNLNILIASDGIKCLNLVCDYVSKNKPIKFILMDNSMPYLDGITTCNIIKNSPVLNQTIYLLSGDDNCIDCKADGFLVKPLDEEDLNKIINKYD